MTKQELQKQVCDACVKMVAIGLVHGTAGNISVRVPGSNEVVISPSAIGYAEYTPEIMSVVDIDGTLLAGPKPSSETPMHTMLHRHLGRDVAIVHTHSPYAATFAALGEEIPVLGLEGLGFGVEKVPVTHAFALPGTPLLGEAVLRVLSEHPTTRVMLLQNHGTLTFADTVANAMMLSDGLEYTARLYYQARCIGTPKTLDAGRIKETNESYTKMKEEALKDS